MDSSLSPAPEANSNKDDKKAAPMKAQAAVKRKNDKSKKIKKKFLNRNQFYASYNRYQNFAFPDSMIHYISKNPSTPKIYQKLVQSCKYFFVKNSILIVSSLNQIYDTRIATLNGLHKSINVANVLSSTKFWIIDSFHVHSRTIKKYNILSTFIPKIYRCDAKMLTFLNETISFNEFLFLSSSANIINFYQVTVMNKDGTVAQIEKLVEACVNLKDFSHDGGPASAASCAPSITFKTFKELLKIPHFLKLDSFVLESIREGFDLESFYIYMKTNKCTKIRLEFFDPLLEAFKNRLKEIYQEIHTTINHQDYIVPSIKFFR